MAPNDLFDPNDPGDLDMVYPGDLDLAVSADEPPPLDTRSLAQAMAPPLSGVWEFLTADQERLQFEALQKWVLWMVDRGELASELRPCWQQHAPAVDNFLALFQRWLEVFPPAGWGGDEDGLVKPGCRVGSDALTWYDQRDRVVARLTAQPGPFTRCLSEHTDREPVGLAETRAEWEAGVDLPFLVARAEGRPVTG